MQPTRVGGPFQQVLCMSLLPQVHPQTVSELTHELKDLVEANLDTVCVCGEISNCKAASSGHVYLTLKDEIGRAHV